MMPEDDGRWPSGSRLTRRHRERCVWRGDLPTYRGVCCAAAALRAPSGPVPVHPHRDAAVVLPVTADVVRVAGRASIVVAADPYVAVAVPPLNASNPDVVRAGRYGNDLDLRGRRRRRCVGVRDLGRRCGRGVDGAACQRERGDERDIEEKDLGSHVTFDAPSTRRTASAVVVRLCDRGARDRGRATDGRAT